MCDALASICFCFIVLMLRHVITAIYFGHSATVTLIVLVGRFFSYSIYGGAVCSFLISAFHHIVR